MAANITTLPPPLSSGWSFSVQTIYMTFDLIGVILKLLCIHIIIKRCQLSHCVYNLIVQYLSFGVLLIIGWLVGGWFISNPLKNTDNFLDWLFIQQMVEILPYDLYQICWAAIAYCRRVSVTQGASVNAVTFTETKIVIMVLLFLPASQRCR
jgi:hypothetical protein